ncbi:MAG: hypothetical protein NTY20_04210 [Candidatus Aenigmarchaeota archaeon]|nr:hypothetical protein [Candidatus Aenigmarchaeota archaeon]
MKKAIVLFDIFIILLAFWVMLTWIAILSLPHPIKEGKYAWGLATISKAEKGYISEGSFVFGTIKIGPAPEPQKEGS